MRFTNPARLGRVLGEQCQGCVTHLGLQLLAE